MSQTFRDFSGRHVLEVARIVTPANLAALRAAVVQAEVEGLGVSAIGSAWAFSAPGWNPGVVVDTSGLVGFPPWLQECVAQPAGTGEIWAAVAAGTKVRDVYRALMGRTANDSEVLLQNSPGDSRVAPPTWLHGRQLAPRTLGGAGGQSLAGVVSTGTHGGDVARPPIGDFVRAAVLVGSGGRVRVVQRLAQRAVDVGRLNALHRDQTGGVDFEEYAVDGGLEAVTTSVGRMGVVFAYVYAVEDMTGQLVYEWRYADRWSSVRAELDSGSIIERARSRDEFLQVVMSPVRDGGEDRPCYVTRHRTDTADNAANEWAAFDDPKLSCPVTPIDVMRLRNGGPLAIVGQIFGVSVVTPQVEQVRVALRIAAVDIALIASSVGGPIGAIAAIPIVAELLDLADDLGTLSGSRLFGDILALHLNHLASGPYSFITTAAIRGIVAGAQSDTVRNPDAGSGDAEQPWLVKGPRGFVLDTYDYRQPPLFRGDSVEVFFAADRQLTRKVQALLDAFESMQQSGVPVAAYVSLRFLAASCALLALTHPDPGTPTCAIEVSMLRGMRGNDQALAAVQRIALENEGRVHWGQENDLGVSEVQESMPRLADWKARLHEIEGTSLTFLTPFAQAHGLDVDRPSTWSGWQNLGFRAGGDPCVAANASRYLVLACDQSGRLQVNTQRVQSVDTRWSQVSDRTFARDCAPTALLRLDDSRVEIMAVTDTEEIGHVWQDGTDGLRFSDLSVKTAPWGVKQLVRTTEISSVQFGNGTMRVFGVEAGGTSRVLQSGLDFLETLVPVDETPVLDRIAAAEWVPTWAGQRNDPLLVAFAAADGKPLWRTYQHGPWSYFPALPGNAGVLHLALMPGIIVASTTAGLFALADATSGAERPTYRGPWQPLPASSVEPVAVENPLGWCFGSGGPWLFARGRTGQLLTIQHVGDSHWGSWTGLGGSVRAGSRPVGGLLPDGRVQVVCRAGGSDPAHEDQLVARRQTSRGVW